MDSRTKTAAMILIFMGVGELLAEPTDGLTIWSLNHLEQIKYTMSPTDYWIQYLFWYYCASAIWYFILAGIFVIWHFKPESINIYLIGALSFSGVLGVIGLLSMDELSFSQVFLMVVIIAAVSVVSIAVLDRWNKKRC